MHLSAASLSWLWLSKKIKKTKQPVVKCGARVISTVGPFWSKLWLNHCWWVFELFMFGCTENYVIGDIDRSWTIDNYLFVSAAFLTCCMYVGPIIQPCLVAFKQWCVSVNSIYLYLHILADRQITYSSDHFWIHCVCSCAVWPGEFGLHQHGAVQGPSGDPRLWAWPPQTGSPIGPRRWQRWWKDLLPRLCQPGEMFLPFYRLIDIIIDTSNRFLHAVVSLMWESPEMLVRVRLGSWT